MNRLENWIVSGEDEVKSFVCMYGMRCGAEKESRERNGGDLMIRMMWSKVPD